MTLSSPSAERLSIEVWSDVVCPFCYIGKRELERALEQFPHRDQVEIRWRSFELDPTIAADPGGNLAQAVASKYGIDEAQAAASQEQIAARAASVGLEFNWRQARFGNTFDAHRLIHLAEKFGLAGAAHERLMRAYFTEGQLVSDPAVLRRLAAEIGLPAEDVERVLSSNEYAHDVRADEARAGALGIRGVPFFVLGGQYGVSGAQPSEVMLAALQQAWDAQHPQPLTLLGDGETGAVCEDGACALPGQPAGSAQDS
ncbi:DsbA family oxidoreductase [Deinococcus sp. Marseille-Q6407]|uniref:DsbA family oxidoreductase n=1 Tax=Deinococcus sp. Marseille-Q6407 TaxID=2969223 RepID=UPI0021BE4055|nr:DsbA family oxidoreductase [Deinococcus sp. Marseille-Q6407]